VCERHAGSGARVRPSAAARLSPERKRLSFMAYTDIVHDVDEQHMGLEQARLA